MQHQDLRTYESPTWHNACTHSLLYACQAKRKACARIYYCPPHPLLAQPSKYLPSLVSLRPIFRRTAMPSITGFWHESVVDDNDNCSSAGEQTMMGSLRQRGTSVNGAGTSCSKSTCERKQFYAQKQTPSFAPSLVSVSTDSLRDFDISSSKAPSKTNTNTTTTAAAATARPIRRSGSHADRESLTRSVSSILHPKRRFATASSLPWGHKPHPLVGLSCLLFALPVPFLISCHPVAAGCFAVVTVTSFMSDHVYTGLDSYAHLVDKFMAPLTFVSALRSVYLTGGLYWACSCTLALSCHVLAHSAAKRNEYERFVFWHAAWHTVGVALLVVCFYVNDTMAECMVGDE